MEAGLAGAGPKGYLLRFISTSINKSLSGYILNLEPFAESQRKGRGGFLLKIEQSGRKNIYIYIYIYIKLLLKLQL